jgi:hypothetical protein
MTVVFVEGPHKQQLSRSRQADPLRRAVILQTGDRIRAPGRHGVLVDVALIGDLAVVDRRRLGNVAIRIYAAVSVIGRLSSPRSVLL